MRTSHLISLILVLFLAACIKILPTVSPITPTPFDSVIVEKIPTNTPYPTRTPVIVVPGNLLKDPSLEGPYHSDGVHPEVNTSYAWKAWYSCGKDTTVCEPPCIPLTPGCGLPCPSNCVRPNGKCQNDYGCYWMRAEYNPFDWGKAPYRVHSGNMSQVHFSYGRMSLGGIQQTAPVTPGALLKFTAWMQAWQCFEYGPACDWGRKTDQPSDMHLRIGIDPTGGTQVTSTNVVWSPEQEAFDRWVEFLVMTRAESNKVTVFTQGGATWDYARMNNDVYLDDLALVYVSPLTNTIYLPAVTR